MLLYISIPTKQKIIIKELEILHFMECQGTFFEYIYFFAALFGCPVVTSDRTLMASSLHSEYVYKDNFWVVTSVKINYFIVR